ncbi:hypothetical protein ODJ79_37600 [Actinoplanes sp. KI2]|uniref:hypothetical protein n=1 Tax=Actinoplanes sp. KI2 TaxID=2983315 RepID=UPI0021D5CCD5|nr:hypothetical protein [Actinoplanes sp. KI2]MCU7729465.1 hypothetical protein [Actinoplanes sp. KI2]
MPRAHTSRFAVRDRGIRRVRSVTVWSAAGSAGLAVAAAIAFVPATASPASGRAVTSGSNAGTTPAAPPEDTARPSRTPAVTARPHPRRTSTPRLTPPTTPPAAATGSQHTSSGGS